ncbi:MAG: DUF1648 domain-containing protein [Lactobacillus sp.]|jgi:uncharacterized membrane protein|nr:DUF1648 domain-containing protein [Lactobacillus sp.]MCI2033895.1 DUF1648 domain-containing protein [Lactobacillus sp.]
MKTKNQLLYTLPVILAPLLYGVAVYSRLPERMASHWGFNNQVNGTMARPFVVFGLPLLMVVVQLIIVGATAYASRHGEQAVRAERVLIWIIPVVTVVAYLTTLQINLGQALDLRRIVVLLVAAIFMTVGNYLPTVPAQYQRQPAWLQRRRSPAAWRRSTRRLGYAMVGGGGLLLLSLLFPAWASTAALVVTLIAITSLSMIPA